MNLTDVGEAASLLRFALVPKQRPTPDSPYRALLDRYRTDAEFAEVVTRIAGGLGIRVHLPTQLGLLLTGASDGPFAVTLDNSGLLRRTGPKQLQDRYCFGLVLVGLAAYAYPNGEALLDSGSPSVRSAELLRFLEAGTRGPRRTRSTSPVKSRAANWARRPSCGATCPRSR